MVNCSFCDKELDRKVFCSNSHKVMFHLKKEVLKETTRYIKENYDVEPKRCEHGMMKRLCKKCMFKKNT